MARGRHRLAVDQLELPFARATVATSEPLPPSVAHALPVEIIRSPRRRKSVHASIVDGVIRVRVPSSMSDDEARRYADELADRLRRRQSSVDINLAARARALADRYDLPRPISVEWSEHQVSCWASCAPSRGRIKVSARAVDLPPWVTDYLLVHELAHLVEGNHSATFWALCERYPLTERARGYLMACDHATASGS